MWIFLCSKLDAFQKMKPLQNSDIIFIEDEKRKNWAGAFSANLFHDWILRRFCCLKIVEGQLLNVYIYVEVILKYFFPAAPPL